MQEKKKITMFFNMFYGEIGDRLDYMEKMGCDIEYIKKMPSISGDIVMGECFFLKVVFTIKDGFVEKDVLKCIRDLRNKKDFNDF